MNSWIQVCILALIGVFLLWFGHTLFFGTNRRTGLYNPGNRRKKPAAFPRKGQPVSSPASVCPLCSARLPPGERVQSTAFPSSGGKDRIMHISGCVYCIDGGRLRICPVCGTELTQDEILFARFFEKPGRSHVHVLGCSRCRRPGKR